MKFDHKALFRLIVLALLVGLVVGYVVICIFFMVIGIVAENTNYFSLGFGGIGLPIVLPVIIGDIKAIFF